MAKVIVGSFLRRAATGEQRISGSTVREVLDELCKQFPSLRIQIFNDEGRLRSFLNVYLNDEDTRYLPRGLDTPVGPEDSVGIVPSIAGGPGPSVEEPRLRPHPFDAHVEILVEGTISAELLPALERAVVSFAEASGLSLIRDNPAESGSWLKRFLFRSEEGDHELYSRMEDALRVATKDEGTRDLPGLAKAAARLIGAIEPFDAVTVRVGRLFIRKSTMKGRRHLHIELLPSSTETQLNGNVDALKAFTQSRALAGSWKDRMRKYISPSASATDAAGSPVQHHQSIKTPVQVLISYAHRDSGLKDELLKHLSLLYREGLVASWHDRDIVAGSTWRDEIDHRLKNSGIILLLVSADFIASEYCYSEEMYQAMQRHEKHTAIVIPVILRPVDWKTAPFAKLEALPRDARPITTWPSRDAAFMDVAQGIRALLSRR
jgi:molybdopterin converting factor small subunit